MYIPWSEKGYVQISEKLTHSFKVKKKKRKTGTLCFPSSIKINQPNEGLDHQETVVLKVSNSL